MQLDIKRKITQIISLILTFGGFAGIAVMHLIYPFLHCYACPFAIAGCPIGLIQRFVILGEIPWYPLGAVTVYGLTLGRAFCGWACPFGFLQDIIGKSGNKRTVDRSLHKKAVVLKFGILVGLVILAWISADVLFCKICPAGTLEAAIPYRIQHGLPISLFFLGKLGVFLGILGAMFLLMRFWCKYLCPFGAWLGAFNKACAMQVNVDLSKCDHCSNSEGRKCEEVCPMDIKVGEIERSFECIRCGKCVDACESGAISFGLMKE